MKIAVFLTRLTLGGSEKAAVRWAIGLHQRGHQVVVCTLEDGPRRLELEHQGLTWRRFDSNSELIAKALQQIEPDVIHAHAPGHPYAGDILGEALERLPKIPLVQTNIFGHLQNTKEDAWTDFRLFISWTSCIQAARRVFH